MNAARKKMDSFCRKLADSLQIGLMAVYPDGEICFCNKSFADMFDIDLRTVIGTNIVRYFPESELLNVIRKQEPQYRITFEFKGRNSLISRYPVMDDGQCIGGYIEAYFDIQDLKKLMTRIESLEKKARYFERKMIAGFPKALFSFSDIIGTSEAIRSLKEQGMRFANSIQPILITGESGTGKELVANALHSASPRSSEIFVSVNCAAIPNTLIEAELFGYKDGAFTGALKGGRIGKFELADRGTIFLDEIAELPLTVQAKLLRVLENHEIQKIGGNTKLYSDFRVIAATNKDLKQLVRNGLFREDLYHRLSVLQLRTPSLRERLEDIPDLVPALLRQIAEQEHAPCPQFDPGILTCFRQYAWPGNIRELKNILIYARLSCDKGPCITAGHLPPNVFHTCKMSLATDGNETLHTVLRDASRLHIEKILAESNGNKALTARRLGISLNELYKKMRQLDI